MCGPFSKETHHKQVTVPWGEAGNGSFVPFEFHIVNLYRKINLKLHKKAIKPLVEYKFQEEKKTILHNR